jgi:MYXO-CTERM domain-containing protein
MVDCDPVDPARLAAECRATLVPMVDAPPGGLVLTLEGGTTSSCTVGSGGGEEPTVIACRALPLAGTGPWAVTIGTASGSVVVATAIAGPPPATTTTSTTVPAEPTTPSVPVWPFAAAGLALLALVVVTAVRRGRR